jgi:hypothetical protein
MSDSASQRADGYKPFEISASIINPGKNSKK